MFTPYDWQEGIGNRAQYIEGKLSQGSPVLAVSLEEGILVFTYRRQARKIYEVYDRLIFAGIGQQSDVEALRMAAVDFASQEGYNRSEQDVTIQRVATALSAPLKKAFSDFSTSPLVARSLFGEVGPSIEDDLYYTLDYDGDYSMSRNRAVIAGTPESAERLAGLLDGVKPKTSPEKAIEALKEIYVSREDDESESSEDRLTGLRPEAILVDRSDAREDRFRILLPEEF